MTGNDPQDAGEIPEEFMARADRLVQERIETSMDEQSYLNGDWVEAVYEIAEELWAQAEEDKRTDRARSPADENRNNPTPPPQDEQDLFCAWVMSQSDESEES